jgi:hypothetical protein
MLIISSIQSVIRSCKNYPWTLFGVIDLLLAGGLLNFGVNGLRYQAKLINAYDRSDVEAPKLDCKLNIVFTLTATILGALLYYAFWAITFYRWCVYLDNKNKQKMLEGPERMNDEKICAYILLFLGAAHFWVNVIISTFSLMNLVHYASEENKLYPQNCTMPLCLSEEVKSRAIEIDGDANGFIFGTLLFGFFAGYTPILLSKCFSKQLHSTPFEDDLKKLDGPSI